MWWYHSYHISVQARTYICEYGLIHNSIYIILLIIIILSLLNAIILYNEIILSNIHIQKLFINIT